MRRTLVLLILLLPAPPAGAEEADSKSFCEEKRVCEQMKDCAEARFYLERCGGKLLDGDGDGIPCEKLCRFN